MTIRRCWRASMAARVSSIDFSTMLTMLTAFLAQRDASLRDARDVEQIVDQARQLSGLAARDVDRAVAPATGRDRRR